MAGIDLFLKTKLGHDLYVYDFENIHYGIFRILFDIKCKEFFNELVKISIDFDDPNINFKFQPNNGLFDFVIETSNGSLFWEIKVWNQLIITQLNNQKKYLEDKDAMGIYVLFTKARKWINNDEIRHDENIIMLDEAVVMKALAAINKQNYSKDVVEIVESYNYIIGELYERY